LAGLPTATTLNITPTSLTYGQQVTFAATVASVPPGGTPTGSVSFIDQTTQSTLATRALSAGAASFITNGVTAGTHAIVANYLGDANYSASFSTAGIACGHRLGGLQRR
jgi:hypothetical protein